MSRLTKVSLSLLALGVVIYAFSNWVGAWFWHPLFGRGYQFWSGIGSDVGEVTLIVGLVTGSVAVRRFLHAHFECHAEGCTKLGVHPVRGTPYRTCWHDHPVLGKHKTKHGVPLDVIHAAHTRALEKEAVASAR